MASMSSWSATWGEIRALFNLAQLMRTRDKQVTGLYLLEGLYLLDPYYLYVVMVFNRYFYI